MLVNVEVFLFNYLNPYGILCFSSALYLGCRNYDSHQINQFTLIRSTVDRSISTEKATAQLCTYFWFEIFFFHKDLTLLTPLSMYSYIFLPPGVTTNEDRCPLLILTEACSQEGLKWMSKSHVWNEWMNSLLSLYTSLHITSQSAIYTHKVYLATG